MVMCAFLRQTFDQEVFEDFKKTVAEQAFTVTDYSSSSLEGVVDVSDNQTLFCQFHMIRMESKGRWQRSKDMSIGMHFYLDVKFLRGEA